MNDRVDEHWTIVKWTEISPIKVTKLYRCVGNLETVFKSKEKIINAKFSMN